MAFIQGQLLTAAALNTAFAQCFPAGGVSSYSATLLSQTSATTWYAALGLPSGNPGSANGIATLDNAGHLPLSQLPAALQGAMTYQGTWNASTNSPALASGSGIKGYLYKVSVAGSTSLDGTTQWNVGDMAVFNGTVWDKWDGISSEVLSVAGRVGAVTLASTDIADSVATGRAVLTGTVPAARVALNIDQATTVNDANQAVTNLMEAVVWTSITAPRTASLPAAASMNQGQAIYIFDESGACSQNNTITINANGTDTINGASSYVLNYARAGIVLMRVSSTKWTAIAASSPPTDAVGFRNRLINGGIDIDQLNEGGAQTFSAGSALAYSVDQWWGACIGANVIGQRASNSGAVGSPSRFCYQFAGAVGTTGVGFGQRIEAANCYDLAGQTATLSVSLANSLLTVVTWTAYYANTANTWGTLTSPNKTQIATGTFSVNSTMARYQIPITIPAAATTGIEIVFSVGAQTGGSWSIGNAQLEAGTYATAFERLPIEQTLTRCQKYFEKSYDIGTAPGTAATNGAEVVDVGPLPSATFLTGGTATFKAPKFAQPVVTLYSTVTGASGKVRDLVNNADVSGVAGNRGMRGFNWSASPSAANTTFNLQTHWIASAQL